MPVNSTFSGSFFPRSTQLNLYDKSSAEIATKDRFIIDTASVEAGAPASLVIGRKVGADDSLDSSKDVDVQMKMKLSQRSGKNMNDVGKMHYDLGKALYEKIYKSGSYAEDSNSAGEAIGEADRGVENEAAIAEVTVANAPSAVNGVNDYQIQVIAPAVLAGIDQVANDKSRVEAVEIRTQAIRDQLEESIRYIAAAASTASGAKDQLGFSDYGKDNANAKDNVYDNQSSIPDYLKLVGVFDNDDIASGHQNKHMNQTKKVITDIETLIGINPANGDNTLDLTNPGPQGSSEIDSADYDLVSSALSDANGKLKNVVWKLGARDEKLSRALLEEAQDRVSQDNALSSAVEDRRQLLEDMLKSEIAATDAMEIRLDARIQHLVSNSDASALDSMREVAEIFNQGQGGLLGHMSKVQSKVDDIVAVLNALIGANYQGAGEDVYLSYLSGSTTRDTTYIDEEHSNSSWSTATSTPADENTETELSGVPIHDAQTAAEAGVAQATADVDSGVDHTVSGDISHAQDAI